MRHWIVVTLWMFLAASGPALGSDLLLYYDFEAPDVATDGQATDVSGNGLHGTISASGTGSFSYVADAPAATGSSQSLDLVEVSSGNLARLSRSITTAQLDFNADNFTWAGFFKRRDTASHDMILHIGQGDGYGGENELYVVAPYNSQTVQLHHYAPQDVNITSGTLALNTWHHAAVVREGANISLYVNGQLVGSDSSFALNMSQSSPVYFGGQNNGGLDRDFDGQLDDQAIWSAPLSSFAIENLANGNFTPLTAPTQRSPDLFLYYSYESPDTTADGLATDNSGHGRTGTLAASGAGGFAYAADKPTGIFGTQSLRLDDNGAANVARLSRSISTAELDFSNDDWTFATWFKSVDTSGVNYVFHIGAGDGFGNDNELYLNATGSSLQLQHHYDNGANIRDIDITASSLDLTQWHHVTVVHDAAAGELRFYVDGQLIGTGSSANFGMLQSNDFVVGGFAGSMTGGSTDRYFDGYLDETALWARTLDGHEIASLFSGEQLTYSVIPEPTAAAALSLAALALIRRRRA